MPSTGDRANCPHCGKDVAVNMDGTLRKHECGEVEPEAEPEVDQASVEPEVDEQPAAEVDDGECACEPESEPAVRAVEQRKDPRLCSVPGCDRPNVLHRVCGAHYASRRGG